jgi:redox-sensitive bicupin YhaK (pirin superfamily)
LAIAPRSRDLGGFSVRRTLPDERRQWSGPSSSMTISAPQFAPGQGMDVRRIAYRAATVTYLCEDASCIATVSECPEIAPGEMNLMTAGRGVVHSSARRPVRAPRARRCSGCRAGSLCAGV